MNAAKFLDTNILLYAYDRFLFHTPVYSSAGHCLP